MSTLLDLVQRSLQELRQAYKSNKIPEEIKNHAGADAIKVVVQFGKHGYTDYGNFPGSLVMLMLLFPQNFGLAKETDALLPMVDEQDSKAEILQNEGSKKQKSGTGQNNYRTNLLEAILDHLTTEARNTQELWMHVGILCEEDEESYTMTQGEFIDKLVSQHGNVSCSKGQIAAFDVCYDLNLSTTTYYKHLKKLAGEILINNEIEIGDYYKLMELSGCTFNNAKKLWGAIKPLRQKLSAPSPESRTASSSKSPGESAVLEMD